MARLPVVDDDDGTWGGILNTYLSVEHNADGTQKTLSVAKGGTGAVDAATARTNLGLGSIATQASSGVTITGGSITGITDLALADGGTGASTASGARTNLDVPSNAQAVKLADTSTSGYGFVVDEDTMTSNSDTKVPTQQSVKAYVDAAASGSSGNFTQEPTIDSLQAFRLLRGKELGRWYSGLSNIESGEAVNVWLLGDSVTEGYGSTSDYKKWTWLLREALQSQYKSGGAGFIPATHVFNPWYYTSNPDSKNFWTYSGTGVDTTDYTFGFGRRGVLIPTTGSAKASITVDCDRVWIVYAEGSGVGTLNVVVDGGAPITRNSQVAIGSSGRILEISGLTLGAHTFEITATALAIIVEGIMVFKGDGDSGVRIYDGGHSGVTSGFYAGSAAGNRYWADIGRQMSNQASFFDGVGNGTTTFTSAGAAFVDNDIGEFIWFAANADASPRGVRIVSRNSGTSVVLDKAVPNGTSLAFYINRAQVTDAVLTNTSKQVTSATAAFTAKDVGKAIKGPAGVPTNTKIERVVNGTTILMSNAATATASSQTLRISNRVAYDTKPDLIVLTIGGNDGLYGTLESDFKTNVTAVITTAKEVANTEVAPSVALVSLYAPGGSATNLSAVGTTVNGSSTITSIGMSFGTEDIGKTITGTGIPGSTTITAVASDHNSATMSAAATASGTGAIFIVNRLRSVRLWRELYAKWIKDLCELNDWAFIDLYPSMGWLGEQSTSTYDPFGYTIDSIHLNDRGNRRMADEIMQQITGSVPPRSLQTTSSTTAQDFLSFNRSGTQTVATGASQFRVPFGINILGIAATAGTAPTGAALLFDVNKNGSTIYTNQANRPTIAISATSGSETVPDTTSFATGDLMRVDVDQIGSTIAGADTVVIIRYERT